MNKMKAPDFLAVIIVLGGIIIFYHFQANDFQKQILANKAITTATVINCEYRNKHNYVVNYKFESNTSETFLGYVNGSEYRALRNLIVGKVFPLVYDSLNPKRNSILIFPDQFERYEVDFPDSLNWVIPQLE